MSHIRFDVEGFGIHQPNVAFSNPAAIGLIHLTRLSMVAHLLENGTDLKESDKQGMQGGKPSQLLLP